MPTMTVSPTISGQTPDHYRPEIDGLRALAIIAVLLFHAGIPGFSGGFVGVDIFFVISGYLITRQVRAQQQAGAFRFSDFYRRRVLRLLPAAASTVMATLVAGTILLPPFRLIELAQSAIAASLSVANIYFWKASDYWAPTAGEQPLLHMWSLGVEEQFYLVWPLLLILSLRWRRGRHAGHAMLALALVSLAATWALTNRSPTPAFFLMPARVYEFAIGAGCVWIEARRVGRPMRGLRAVQLIVGIGLMLIAIVSFNARTAFPGVAALIPTIGAALVILAGRPGRLDGLLSNAAAVAIGRRSYSLYLVHWPVLVIWSLARGPLERGPLSTGELVAALLVTAALTQLQYHLVENRFRMRRAAARMPGQVRPQRAWPVLSLSVSVAAAGALLVAADGLPQRIPHDIREIATTTLDQVNTSRAERTTALCGSDALRPVCGHVDPSRRNILVLGDSHAPDGVNILANALPEANLLVAGHGGCPPFPATDVFGPDRSSCIRSNRSRMAEVASLALEIQSVVVSIRLTEERLEPTETLIRWLLEAGYPQVIVLGVGPSHPVDMQDLVVKVGFEDAQARTDGPLAESDLVGRSAAFRTVVEGAGGIYVDKLQWMCPQGRCRVTIPGTTNQLLIFDRHHLTRAAADAFGRTLLQSDLEGSHLASN